MEEQDQCEARTLLHFEHINIIRDKYHVIEMCAKVQERDNY